MDKWSVREAQLQRLDLQRQVARENPALRQASGGEPEPGLCGAPPHVAQLSALVESPDRSDALGDLVAEIKANGFLLVLVAGRQHQQFGRYDAPVAQSRAFGQEPLNVGELKQADRTGNDQLGAADVEVIAAATAQI